MERELHRLIREACGGEWNDQASRIWDLIQSDLESAIKMYRDANDAFRRRVSELEAALARQPST